MDCRSDIGMFYQASKGGYMSVANMYMMQQAMKNNPDTRRNEGMSEGVVDMGIEMEMGSIVSH